MEFVSGFAALFGMVWNYCSATCLQRSINATMLEIESQIQSCPGCKARNGERLEEGDLEPMTVEDETQDRDTSGVVTMPLQDVSPCNDPATMNSRPRSPTKKPASPSRPNSCSRSPRPAASKVGSPKKPKSPSRPKSCHEQEEMPVPVVRRSPSPKPEVQSTQTRRSNRIANKQGRSCKLPSEPPTTVRPRRPRILKKNHPTTSGNTSRPRLCKPGKVTRNPFFNFLREYRAKRCGQQQRLIVHDGAQIWNRMSFQERCKYAQCVNLGAKRPRGRK